MNLAFSVYVFIYGCVLVRYVDEWFVEISSSPTRYYR